jgi:hypothetical protein
MDYPCAAPADTAFGGTTGVTIAAAAYDQAASEYGHLSCFLPDDYDGSALKFNVFWSCTAGTTGVVRWILYAGCFDDDAPLGTSIGNATTLDDTFIAQDDMHVATVSSKTPDNASNGLLHIIIRRQGDSGSDTFDADALLLGVSVEYA